jgi:hypothetical protein
VDGIGKTQGKRYLVTLTKVEHKRYRVPEADFLGNLNGLNKKLYRRCHGAPVKFFNGLVRVSRRQRRGDQASVAEKIKKSYKNGAIMEI